MEFRPLGNESSPFCRTEWFHIHVKTAVIHLSVWLIGQGGWKLRVDPGLIPGSSKLRQKSVVGQEIANLRIWNFLKLENFNPILKFTYLTASSSRFGDLAKAM